MILLSFARVVKFALQDLVRNMSLSLMTIIMLVLMLLSVNTFVLLRALTGQAIQSVNDHIDVSIFFATETPPKQIDEIRSFVVSFPEVVSTTYMSAEDVLAEFKQHYADNAQVIASLDELKENPLGPTLIVQTRSPGDYEKIMTALRIPEYEDVIEAKTFADTQKAINRIHVITTWVEQVSMILIALFAIIAFLIIFNTIRVAIYTQRVEIGIKKLVGATNWFIRGPYFIEGIVFSLISVAITVGVVLLTIRTVDPYLTAVFGQSSILTDYFYQHILLVIGGEFVAVLALTFFSSWLAMSRHLKV